MSLPDFRIVSGYNNTGIQVAALGWVKVNR